MVDFSKLKKNRIAELDKLNKKLQEKERGVFSNDDEGKFFKLTTDAAGNGSALIRFFFLPYEDELPWVTRHENAFQGPTTKLWYIETSRRTLGYDEPDPVIEFNNPNWNDPTKKELARKLNPKKRHIANILVINDPAKPENNGKVFLFKFGKKIMDKIKELQNPDEISGDEKIDPFDMWNGVDFRFIQTRDGEYPNYDKSKFAVRQTQIAETDEEIEAIWKQRHNLAELVSEKAVKSYDELKAKFDRVMGFSGSRKSFNTWDDSEEETNNTVPVDNQLDFSEPVTKKTSTTDKTTNSYKDIFNEDSENTSGSVDEDEEFFKSLAN